MTKLAAINRQTLAEVAPHLVPPEVSAPVAGAIDLVALNARRRALFNAAFAPAAQVTLEPVRVAGPVGQDGTVSVNWLMNEDNHGWAYGNNARRLMNALPHYAHVFDDPAQMVDIALSFDIKVAQRADIRARRQVLRVGGLRPIRSLYGNPVDTTKLYEAMRPFDAVIVLNRELYQVFAEIHDNVTLIPNGIDVTQWKPVDAPKPGRFVLGFAGSIVNDKERQIKGYDLVVEAARRAGVELITTTKGRAQVPNDQMRSAFYKRIDLLVHPVAPGKEGCSNVITEALALGVPVLTTTDCGYHADFDASETGLFYTGRDVAEITRRIVQLRADLDARIRARRTGRQFVTRHQDVTIVARAYDTVFRDVAMAERRSDLRQEMMASRAMGKRVVQFVPFWLPPQDSATGRLRNLQPADYLQRFGGAFQTLASERLDSAVPDIVFLSQLATDDNLEWVLQNRDRVFVVYDICDDYLSDTRTLAGVVGQDRADELMNLSDLVLVPSAELKRRINRRFPAIPVRVMDDGMDYDLGSHLDQALAGSSDWESDVVLWFGNPGRGNFDSAVPMFDAVLKDGRNRLQMVTKPSYIREHFAPYMPHVVPWEASDLLERLRRAKATLVSHAADFQYKSPNRMITSLCAGTPAVVWNSASCTALAHEMGLPELCIDDPADLPGLLDRLSDPTERQRIITQAVRHLGVTMAARSVGRRYATLIDKYTYRKVPGHPRRPGCILFVTHNLEPAEGAPRSLMELAQGLRERFQHDVVVLSFVNGKLGQEYRVRGLRLIVSEQAGGLTDISEIYAGNRLDRAMAEINGIIDRYRVEFCVLNTAKTLPIADALRKVLPTLCLVRESSTEHVDLSVFPPGPRAAASMFLESGHVGFVAEATRALWARSHKMRNPKVIPNGIRTERFDAAMRMTKERAKRQLGLGPDVPMLLCMGSTNRRKNQEQLVEAFVAADPGTDGRAHLFIVGAAHNEYTIGLRQTIEALPERLRTRIHLVPATNETGVYFRAADAHCFTSLNESYPRVIIEGMVFGLPQIAYRTFGIVEQVHHGVDGDLVEIGDVMGFAGAIRRFLTDADHRARLTRNAQDSFAHLEDYNTMLLAYEAACRDILQQFGQHVVGA
ncbi:MAG: glycosyltransferase family 4 protein [Gemmobacter sp.]